MHITIIIGGIIGSSGLAMVLFLGLKTYLDVATHRLKHRWRQVAPGVEAVAAPDLHEGG
jgi:hypothetical protein